MATYPTQPYSLGEQYIIPTTNQPIVDICSYTPILPCPYSPQLTKSVVSTCENNCLPNMCKLFANLDRMTSALERGNPVPAPLPAIAQTLYADDAAFYLASQSNKRGDSYYNTQGQVQIAIC